MTNLITSSKARAYVNFGRWIADCPLNCGNAVALEPNQNQFFCNSAGGCGHIAALEWPNNTAEIWDVLMERPMPKTRNWFPSNHDLALRSGSPHGQTVQALRDEAHENGVS